MSDQSRTTPICDNMISNNKVYVQIFIRFCPLALWAEQRMKLIDLLDKPSRTFLKLFRWTRIRTSGIMHKTQHPRS